MVKGRNGRVNHTEKDLIYREVLFCVLLKKTNVALKITFFQVLLKMYISKVHCQKSMLK